MTGSRIPVEVDEIVFRALTPTRTFTSPWRSTASAGGSASTASQPAAQAWPSCAGGRSSSAASGSERSKAPAATAPASSGTCRPRARPCGRSPVPTGGCVGTGASPIRSTHRHADEQDPPLRPAAARTDRDRAGGLQALPPISRPRWQHLTDEITDLEQAIGTITAHAAPQLLDQFGVGPDVAAALLIAAGGNPTRLRREASFAALCGVNPLPASSGKTRRHRLNRGGDRQANAALHTVPDALGPTHPLLRRPPHPTRANPTRDNALPQALLARDLYPLILLSQPG